MLQRNHGKHACQNKLDASKAFIMPYICSFLQMRSPIPIKYFTKKTAMNRKYVSNLPKHWKIHERLACIDRLKTGHQ